MEPFQVKKPAPAPARKPAQVKKPVKKGMTTAQKVMIAALVVAIVGGGYYMYTQSKSESTAPPAMRMFYF
jgi:hypothetical protein